MFENSLVFVKIFYNYARKRMIARFITKKETIVIEKLIISDIFELFYLKTKENKKKSMLKVNN